MNALLYLIVGGGTRPHLRHGLTTPEGDFEHAALDLRSPVGSGCTELQIGGRFVHVRGDNRLAEATDNAALRERLDGPR